MNYRSKLLQHLGDYKETTLHITTKGVHRRTGRHYSHILPDDLKQLNILAPIRSAFWNSPFSKVRLHRDFHHLNSSQAMCFNLFFPFFGLNEPRCDFIQSALGVRAAEVHNPRFEYEIDASEGTNFDFYWEYADGARILCELKLSEQDFGIAEINQRRLDKLRTAYRPRLEGRVCDGMLEPRRFFANYQILRNVFHLRDKDMLLLVYPRENLSLVALEPQWKAMLAPAVRAQIRIVYLEDIVKRLANSIPETLGTLREAIDAFRLKYIIPDSVPRLPVSANLQALQGLADLVSTGSLAFGSSCNIQRWLTPPYREFHPALHALIERRDAGELTRLFWTRIPFGTGGRRGPMAELGSATMNRRTIAESAFGLAMYVKQALASTTPSVAVAYDTRLRSREFAEVTACVMAAQGFRVAFYPEPRATPQLSFTVRTLGCDCGVMISASHNPPADNGFKAYWSHGGQVLPPHDRGIIECVEAAEEIPVVFFEDAVRDGQIELLDDRLTQAYADAVCALSLKSETSPPATSDPLRILYTPLHGVGEASVFRVLQQAGFDVELFEPQRSQDGNFPNVPDQLPNPERTVVFQPAISHAKVHGHDLILASDPDADRIAVAVRESDGEFTCLTGNQLGALLTDFVLAMRINEGTLSPDHYVLETLVTTPLVAAIVRHYGVDVLRDLPVGFKTMAAVVEERGAERFVFAVEESVGYMAGDYCRDKDASLGALWAAELAAELKSRGATLCDRLRELHQRHGVHLEAQVAREFPGPGGVMHIRSLVRRLREQPPGLWGSITLNSVRDYGRQEVRSLPENLTTATLHVDAGDLLFLDGSQGDLQMQLGMRPSGTEPKIKFYLFVQARPDDDVALQMRACERLMSEMQAALDLWLSVEPASAEATSR